MKQVLMPRLSDSMEEGAIISWLVENGAMVAALGAEVVRRGIAPSDLSLAVDSSRPVTAIVA